MLRYTSHMLNTTPAQSAPAASFALYRPAGNGAWHLAPLAGGPFLCGKPAGRSQWAMVGIVPGVTANGCPGCYAAAPAPTR